MSQFEVDFVALKRPLMLLGLLFFVSALLVWSTAGIKNSQQARLQQARSELEMQRSEFRLAVEAGDIMQTSQQRFSELEQMNFIGKEQRLLWIESLRSNGHEHRLYNLGYALKQQHAVNSNEDSYEYYQLYASPMNLHLELVHEGYLVEFFETLKRDKSAIYQLRSCSMTSKLDDNGIHFDTPNITADCNLVWYTVRPFANDSETDYENS